MTISPGDPGPTDPASGDRPVPPYEDRRRSADVDPEEEAHRDGADVGGATGPVESSPEEGDSADNPTGTTDAEDGTPEGGTPEGGGPEGGGPEGGGPEGGGTPAGGG